MGAGRTRRDQIAAHIEAYAVRHGGQSPTLQEIAEALGINKSAVEWNIQRLIAEERAMRLDGKLWLTQPPLFVLSDNKLDDRASDT